MEKKHKLIYWILTILMFVPGVIGGVVEVFTDGPESIVKIMLFLGYPVIPPFLALARNRGQAARANFCLGVMPPRAIFGLS
jgi:cytochrome c oxidase assembly factor CtaG